MSRSTALRGLIFCCAIGVGCGGGAGPGGASAPLVEEPGGGSGGPGANGLGAITTLRERDSSCSKVALSMATSMRGPTGEPALRTSCFPLFSWQFALGTVLVASD